jgi:hypothetical protein
MPKADESKDPIQDLSRTAAAIAAYDAFDATWADGLDQDQAVAWFSQLETLGMLVGVAFGHDTADRNSMDTCKRCIRPGDKTPSPGCELSFVRRTVAKWEALK